MNWNAREWRVIVGGVAAASAAVLGFAGTTASAEPVVPAPPVPAPATVTETVTVTPQSAPAAANPAATPQAATGPAAASPGPAAAAATPAATPGSPLEPASSGTLAEFLSDNRVAVEPQRAEGFTALNIVLPMPAGWRVVPDPNVPDAFAVIADRTGGDALYTPNAQLFVAKLVGDFDPRKAISHGYVDSQKLRVWQSTGASMADFGGFPSSVIEGTYRENDLTLNTSRRHLIATAGADRYLVSLYVTTAANQVVATANATDAIINGFRVTVPGASAAPRAAAGENAPAAAAGTATPAPAAAAADAAASPAPAAPVADAAASPAAAADAEPVEPAERAEPAEPAEPAQAAQAAEPAA